MSSHHRGFVFDEAQAHARLQQISDKYGLAVDANALVKDLPVGLQQRIEIIKALYRNARILILDEPTAVLTPQESDELFRIMGQLVADGVSIFFITHSRCALSSFDCAQDRFSRSVRAEVAQCAPELCSGEISVAATRDFAQTAFGSKSRCS